MTELCTLYHFGYVLFAKPEVRMVGYCHFFVILGAKGSIKKPKKSILSSLNNKLPIGSDRDDQKGAKFFRICDFSR